MSQIINVYLILSQFFSVPLTVENLSHCAVMIINRSDSIIIHAQKNDKGFIEKNISLNIHILYSTLVSQHASAHLKVEKIIKDIFSQFV